MTEFDHGWLDKSYNELTDEQLKAVADFYQDWGDRPALRACVYMMALRTTLAAKDAEIATGREQEKWLNKQWAAEKARAERAEQEAAGLRMAIEISVMRLLDGTEPREVAKGLCATLAAESEAARAGGGHE